jgi:hypothetical protein
VGEEVAHVAAEDEGLCDAAEDGDGGGEAEAVQHLGGVWGEGFEEVVVLHGAEGSFDHGVLEVGGAVVGGDLAGEVLGDAEMRGSPADELAEADEAGGDSADGLLAGLLGAEEMDLDAAGEVKAALDGGLDEGAEVEFDHDYLRDSFVLRDGPTARRGGHFVTCVLERR